MALQTWVGKVHSFSVFLGPNRAATFHLLPELSENQLLFSPPNLI